MAQHEGPRHTEGSGTYGWSPVKGVRRPAVLAGRIGRLPVHRAARRSERIPARSERCGRTGALAAGRARAPYEPGARASQRGRQRDSERGRCTATSAGALQPGRRRSARRASRSAAGPDRCRSRDHEAGARGWSKAGRSFWDGPLGGEARARGKREREVGGWAVGFGCCFEGRPVQADAPQATAAEVGSLRFHRLVGKQGASRRQHRRR